MKSHPSFDEFPHLNLVPVIETVLCVVEKAKSIDEARDNVKDLLKRIEDRIEAEIDTFLQYR